MAIEVGQQLLHYRLIKKIGQGGMGVVYEATDTRLNRNVAIKILPPELTQNPERSARFQQEAQLAAAFNHPNIATVHDVGEDRGVSFIVMEVVRGDSLRELVRQGPLEVERAVEIACGVAAGLARAHREGVLHRDLKPDNVMLTDEGQPKILDFGLGKLIQEARLPDAPAVSYAPTATIDAADHQGSPYVTRDGQVIGTLSYMSPEQLQGGAVDARTDVFSFGVMLYEMLAGGRPFGGNSTLETMTAILRDEPAPLESSRPGLPGELRTIVDRCLAKDPAERYASGQELLEVLTRLRDRSAASTSFIQRPVFRIVAVIVVLGLLGGIGWLGLRAKRTSWARNEALPEAARLVDTGDWDGAMRLLREVAVVIPDDPRLQQLTADVLFPISIESEPSGATVFVKGYTAVDRPWIRLGTTPLTEVPVVAPARMRVEQEGYLPFEGGLFTAAELSIKLYREAEVPQGMVHVPAGSVSFEDVGPVELDAFWIDRYEVTNQQYKAFVDDGGYRNPEFWHEAFQQDGVEITWEQASAQFVDSTGRPGPAGWELGSYTDGTADHPVSGISWYEAAAFAAWSGKSLPTVFHWHQAARQNIWGEILVVSNLAGDGPAPVGSYAGVGRFGTYDMAGNVSEWCLNASGNNRYVLGGAWSEPSYRYQDTAAADPFDRSMIFGLRRIQTDGALTAAAIAGIEDPVYDFRQEQPIGDDAFEIIRGMFAYDHSPLDARVESVRETPEHWREEIVTIRAAYGDERIPIHIYLPRNSRPPYQTVLYMPGSDAVALTSSRNMRLTFASFIPRSGRALVYPVYKGTYERKVQLSGQIDIRDRLIQMNKDLRRTIDYLETRDDIDTGKLGYYGLSWGSTYGPVHTAIEDRFAASVLLVGGLYRYSSERPPEALPINFFPRAMVPTLMINSRNDFNLPIETNVKPALGFLGAPDEDKHLAVIDGGHVPVSPNEFIREALDWFDRYLGPVEGG